VSKVHQKRIVQLEQTMVNVYSSYSVIEQVNAMTEFKITALTALFVITTMSIVPLDLLSTSTFFTRVEHAFLQE